MTDASGCAENHNETQRSISADKCAEKGGQITGDNSKNTSAIDIQVSIGNNFMSMMHVNP